MAGRLGDGSEREDADAAGGRRHGRRHGSGHRVPEERLRPKSKAKRQSPNKHFTRALKSCSIKLNFNELRLTLPGKAPGDCGFMCGAASGEKCAALSVQLTIKKIIKT